VIRHTAPVLCLWLGKTLAELADGDFDTAALEAERIDVTPTGSPGGPRRGWREEP